MDTMPATTKKRMIPRAIAAAEKLSPETLQGLRDYYASNALRKTTDRGEYDPSKQRAKWVKQVLKESPEIAEKCISRLLWHHEHETVRLSGGKDFQYLVGLMHFDVDGGPVMSREQESGLLKTARCLNGHMEHKFGLTSLSKTYGQALIGSTISDYTLGEYVLEHPERADDICYIIRSRGVIDTVNIAGLLESMGTRALNEGVL